MIDFLHIIILAAIAALCNSLLWYKTGWRITKETESGESKLKSFFKEFIFNYLLALFIIVAIKFLDIITGQ